jgi:hypothetical protein
MKQFRIEVASNGQAHTFNIAELGGEHYNIYRENDKIGTIKIDGKEHEHCEAIDCEIDMPLLNAIREGIILHNELSSGSDKR